MAVWDALVHFRAVEDDKAYFAPIPLGQTDLEGRQVQGYSLIQEIEGGVAHTKVTIKELLAPVPALQPVVCIGLNYRKHVEESGHEAPANPAMWYKPARAIANPNSEIPIPKICQENFLDYEGELVFVLSKTARDVSVEDAGNYILGYTVGNDLTARLFQDPKKNGGQYTYAKGFDYFAPLGPVLVSPAAFEANAKNLTTRVNGKVVQDSPMDFVFSVNQIISFLSQGTTLEAGTAVMTGTPSGVGWFQKPQYSLKDGDVVEVEIAPIGILRHTIKFE